MYKPTIIDLPLPPMGGKCWLLENKGLFVLEPGPGTIRTLAVTHAGSGSIEVIDGIPDENGFFPDEAMQRPAPFTQDEYAMIQTARRTQADPPDWLALKIQDHQIWGSRRGRIFWNLPEPFGTLQMPRARNEARNASESFRVTPSRAPRRPPAIPAGL